MTLYTDNIQTQGVPLCQSNERFRYHSNPARGSASLCILSAYRVCRPTAGDWSGRGVVSGRPDPVVWLDKGLCRDQQMDGDSS